MGQEEQLGVRYYFRLLRYGRRWARLLFKATREALAPESSLTAAAISYYTLFSLFPLTLMTIAIASYLIDPETAKSAVISQLEFVTPALGDLLGTNIERIVNARGSITGVAILTLLWSSSSIFNVLTRALNRAWHVEAERPSWRRRLLALVLSLGVSGVLLGASFAQDATLTFAKALLPPDLQSIRPLATLFWSPLASVLLFSTLYYFLPHAAVSLRDVLPGAIVGGMLWELAKRAFLFFVATYLSRSNLVYGSLATLTAFLTWAYLSGIILLLGAHLNVAYKELVQGN